jgi:transposase
VVETLVERGFHVYAINPKQLDRFRDRHSVAGAKDDRRDAFVLADSLRTDRDCFRRVRLDDPVVIQLRELSRVDEDLKRESNQLANRLREQLHRFYVQALKLCPAADEPWLWSLLELAPSPQAARGLRTKRVERLLREHRIRRVSAEQVLAALRAPALQVAPGVVEAATEHIGLLLLAGERDPERLAAFRDYHCHASHAEIVAALTGNYRPEHLFALRQNFAAYEFLLKQIAECDREIEGLLNSLAAQQPPPSAPLPAARRKRVSKHQPQFDIRGPLHRLTGGVDLSQIDSIGPQAALHLIGEIGTNMTRWPSEKHFTSWLALAPNNKISGGRLLSSRTPPSANRAAVILPRCAMSLTRTSTALGAFYRRLAMRVGKAKAITATARKLAVLVYRVLSGYLVYHDPGADAYHQLNRDRELRSLRKRAKLLGLELLDLSTGEVVLMSPVF